MPPNPNQKKKKKGRAPAHQNTFSFQHNPRSKKTAAILATPIDHCCRRCREKLEWRKQYRKYKPRTTPGKCNHCQKKNVRAAYHTICESCTRTSAKSLELLKTWNLEKKAAAAKRKEEKARDPEPQDGVEDSVVSLNDERTPEETKNDSVEQETSTASSVTVYKRVCAMCVKEPALPGPDDYSDDDQNEGSFARLTLRERKTLIRRQERAAAERRQRRNHSGQSEGSDEEPGNEATENDLDEENDTFEGELEAANGEEDPFLKAVGGADKLLTGEAYQQMLLQKELPSQSA